MSAFFAQKTSEEHLASLKSPSRQNPQIQETNFGNSVSCNGYAENGFKSYRTKCVDENRFQALKIKG